MLPRDTRYARLGVPVEATAEQIRAAAARLDAALKARGADEAELAKAHSDDLENAEARAAYDDQHPPLGLMRLLPVWDPILDDRATGLFVLRRELEAFLLRAGEPVYQPSDLTRTDFSGDFRRCPLLDDPAGTSP